MTWTEKGRNFRAEPRWQTWLGLLLSGVVLLGGPVGFFVLCHLALIPLFPLLLLGEHLDDSGQLLAGFVLLFAAVGWGAVARVALVEIGVRNRYLLPLAGVAVLWAAWPTVLLTFLVD